MTSTRNINVRNLLQQNDHSAINLGGVHVANAFHRLDMDIDFRNKNFQNANFSGANLTRAFFQGANLSGANFTGAILTHAYFDEANLTGANFTGATLNEASFRDTNAQESNFTRANLTGSFLERTVLDSANLEQTNFSFAFLDSTSLRNVYWEAADFTGATITNVEITGAYTNDHQIPYQPGGTFWNPEQGGVAQQNIVQPLLQDDLAMQVHIETRKNMEAAPELLIKLRDHMGTTNTSKYSDILKYLEDTIGMYIQTNAVFTKNRNTFYTDFKEIQQRLFDYKNTGILNETNKQLIGNIVDFVFKYNMEECFIRGLVYDCAHAYEAGTPGHESGISCGRGIIERFVSTFKNCIFTTDTNKAVEKNNARGAGAGTRSPLILNELRELLRIHTNRNSKNKTIETITKNEKQEYDMLWNKALQTWTLEKSENATTKQMNKSTKNKAFLEYVKEKYKEGYQKNIPKGVLDYFEQKITELDWDLFFFGGKQYTRRQKYRLKKRKITRKN